MKLAGAFHFLNPSRRRQPRFSFAEFSRIAPGSLWLVVAAAVYAQQPTPPAPVAAGSASDPFAMDLDSLFNTKVTTASKFSEKLSDAAGVVSVVTQDELQRFGGTTLLEVLERVAGLNVSQQFSGGQQPDRDTGRPDSGERRAHSDPDQRAPGAGNSGGRRQQRHPGILSDRYSGANRGGEGPRFGAVWIGRVLRV